MIIATHQPNYIPWLGYFYKISKCDVFVFLDDVQFSKKGAHNYHFIKGIEGSVKLNIPVKHNYTDPINEVRTNDNGGWKNRHLDLVHNFYKDAPFFDEVFSDYKTVLSADYNNLAELNISIIKMISHKFGFEKKFIKSSELNLKSINEKKIIDICENLGATVYYSGKGAKAYQNEENFCKRNIKLIYDDFMPMQYKQMYGEFLANVSILDFLMNCGYNWHLVKTNFS